jgi:structural maintenance of chromosome 4
VSKLSGSASCASPEDRARITELEGEIIRMSKEFSSLSAISTALEAEVSRLQKQILEAGGEKVRRGKARCDRARESVEETEKALTKIKADIKAAEKTAEKAKKVVEKAKADIMEARGAIEKLKQQSEALVDVAVEAEKEKKEAEEARAAAEKALTAVRTEALQAEKEMRKLKETEKDLTAASDEAEAICMGLKKKVSQWQSKFDALKADYAAKIQEAIADKEADMLSSGEITKEVGSGVEESKDDGADPSKRSAKVAFDEPLTLAELPEASLKGLATDDIQHAISMAETERDTIAKRVNMSSIAEFRTKNREYLRRVADLDHITQARDAARKQWETLRKQRLDEFMSGFRYG